MSTPDSSARTFPIQLERGAKPHPLRIPWSVAEKAYSVYAAQHGTKQSLERLAERGGFGPREMDDFVPNWREESDTISALHSANEKLRGECEELRGIATRAVALAEKGLGLVDLQQRRHKEISDKTDSIIDRYEAEAAARAAEGGD